MAEDVLEAYMRLPFADRRAIARRMDGSARRALHQALDRKMGGPFYDFSTYSPWLRTHFATWLSAEEGPLTPATRNALAQALSEGALQTERREPASQSS